MAVGIVVAAGLAAGFGFWGPSGAQTPQSPAVTWPTLPAQPSGANTVTAPSEAQWAYEKLSAAHDGQFVGRLRPAVRTDSARARAVGWVLVANLTTGYSSPAILSGPVPLELGKPGLTGRDVRPGLGALAVVVADDVDGTLVVPDAPHAILLVDEEAAARRREPLREVNGSPAPLQSRDVMATPLEQFALFDPEQVAAAPARAGREPAAAPDTLRVSSQLGYRVHGLTFCVAVATPEGARVLAFPRGSSARQVRDGDSSGQAGEPPRQPTGLIVFAPATTRNGDEHGDAAAGGPYSGETEIIWDSENAAPSTLQGHARQNAAKCGAFSGRVFDVVLP